MLAPVMQAFGNAAQQEYFLPRILSGEDWWCQGYSEPGSGSDLASLRTSAVRQGDHYIVNGQKTWNTMGQYADWIFCSGAHQQRGPPAAGDLLSADRHEVARASRVRPIIMLDGEHEINDIFFDNVKVPVQNLIGEENKGWTYAKFLLTPRAQRQCRHRHLQAGAEEAQGDCGRADCRTAGRSSRIRASATASRRSRWS